MDPIGYNSRGAVRVESGNREDLDLAIEDFSKVLALDWNQKSAHYNRGAAKAKKGDVAGAIADFTEEIEKYPEHAYAYMARGSMRQELGDVKGAIADCSAAIKLDSRNYYAYSVRGMARASTDPDGALSDFEEALNWAPPDWVNRSDVKRAIEELRRPR